MTANSKSLGYVPLKSREYKPELHFRRLTILKTGVKYALLQTPIVQGLHPPTNTGFRHPVGERRKDNLDALRQRVHDLVECNNGQYGYEAMFHTFTFAENMTDQKRAWQEWHKYMKRLNRALGYTAKYLCVMEFQERGAVHFHAIMFNVPPEFLEKDPYANDWYKSRIAQLWGLGIVKVERIRSVKNVSAYVCSYLNKSAEDIRLRGQKFYTTSNDLFRPEYYYGVDATEKFDRLATRLNFSTVEEHISQRTGNRYLTYEFLPVVSS